MSKLLSHISRPKNIKSYKLVLINKELIKNSKYVLVFAQNISRLMVNTQVIRWLKACYYKQSAYEKFKTCPFSANVRLK